MTTGRKARFFAEKIRDKFHGQIMKYAYRHKQTIGTTGFFACEPLQELSFGKLLKLLESSAGDSFLRKHLLLGLEKLRPRQLAALCRLARKSGNLASLLLQYAVLKGPGCALAANLKDLENACASYPLEYLAQKHSPRDLLEDMKLCGGYFADNIHKHHKFPRDSKIEHLFASQEVCQARDAMPANADRLAALRKQRFNEATNEVCQDNSRTLQTALLALERANILAGPEMRHEKSLSPIGLLREWHLSANSLDGEQASELSGIATAYGRALSIPAARVSLAMEIVERASAHAEIRFGGETGEVGGRKAPMPLFCASVNDLEAGKLDFAFPKSPFQPQTWKDVKLKWVKGKDRKGNEVLVPAQAVFLFSNMSEPELFATTGSTGLASGTSREFARLSALLEIIERDAHATTPYYAQACFCVKSRDQRIQGLLDDYVAQGIFVQFQDITTEVGVPAYRCFVTGRDGTICQAAAAALNGKKAALSALTETPWDYSFGRHPGKASMPPIRRMPRIYLEDLPNYEMGSISASLNLVEEVLEAQGLWPVYVDLTRADLDLPVCRAIVSGLEVNADFDDFNFPSARLLARQKILFESNIQA